MTAYQGEDRRHECQKQEKFEQYERFIGKVDNNLTNIDKCIAELFKKQGETLEAINDLKTLNALTKQKLGIWVWWIITAISFFLSIISAFIIEKIKSVFTS